MKKLLFFFLYVLISNAALAQFSLSMDNAPVADSRYYFARALVGSLNFLDEGSNKTWDFSSMIFTGDTTNTYYTSDTNFVIFPQAPLFLPPGASCNRRTNGLGLMVTSSRYFVVYEATYYPSAGYMPTSVNYSIMEFPFSYGDSLDTSWGTGTWTTVDRYIKCDAYGQLILPHITYNNLMRVHTYQKKSDDTAIPGPHNVIDTVYTNDFSWYSEHGNVPVLSIQTTWTDSWRDGLPTTYADTLVKVYNRFENVIGVSKIDSYANSILVYPNPFSDISRVYIKVNNPGVYKFKLVDLGGRIISGHTQYLLSDLDQIDYSFQGINPGIYFLICELNGKYLTQKKLIKL